MAKLIALADIVGANSTVALSSTALEARFYKVAVVGGGTVRLGVGATTAKGTAIVSGNGVVDIELDGSDVNETFEMSAEQAYVPTGTTLTVSAGVG